MTSLCQEGRFICFHSVDPEANRNSPSTVEINYFFLDLFVLVEPNTKGLIKHNMRMVPVKLIHLFLP